MIREIGVGIQDIPTTRNTSVGKRYIKTVVTLQSFGGLS